MTLHIKCKQHVANNFLNFRTAAILKVWQLFESFLAGHLSYIAFILNKNISINTFTKIVVLDIFSELPSLTYDFQIFFDIRAIC